MAKNGYVTERLKWLAVTTTDNKIAIVCTTTDNKIAIGGTVVCGAIFGRVNFKSVNFIESEIDILFTHPEYRNLGLGAHMVKRYEEELKEKVHNKFKDNAKGLNCKIDIKVHVEKNATRFWRRYAKYKWKDKKKLLLSKSIDLTVLGK